MALVLVLLLISWRSAFCADYNSLLPKADSGDAAAQFEVGRALLLGQGVSRDEKKAFEWFSKAAEQDHAESIAGLAVIYREGRIVAKDEERARALFERAAEGGSLMAAYNLGIMFMNGVGGRTDCSRGRRLMEKAAEVDFKSSRRDLALAYYHSAMELQDSSSYQRAYFWAEKAASNGDPQAQNLLGVLYQHGKGIGQDNNKAALWYERSARQGNAKAQANLGDLYALGKGVKTDAIQALMWFYLSADQNEVTAINSLADYEKGRSVTEKATARKLADSFAVKAE